VLRQRARWTDTSAESPNRVACLCMSMPRRNPSAPSLESRLLLADELPGSTVSAKGSEVSVVQSGEIF
jgi:hypothetical protein